MKPIVSIGVDITTCSQCPWQIGGDHIEQWRAHTRSEHPQYAGQLDAIVAAISGTGTWDTSYEAACIRLAGIILAPPES